LLPTVTIKKTFICALHAILPLELGRGRAVGKTSAIEESWSNVTGVLREGAVVVGNSLPLVAIAAEGVRKHVSDCGNDSESTGIILF